jgi:hypothetical protein
VLLGALVSSLSSSAVTTHVFLLCTAKQASKMDLGMPTKKDVPFHLRPRLFARHEASTQAPKHLRGFLNSAPHVSAIPRVSVQQRP